MVSNILENKNEWGVLIKELDGVFSCTDCNIEDIILYGSSLVSKNSGKSDYDVCVIASNLIGKSKKKIVEQLDLKLKSRTGLKVDITLCDILDVTYNCRNDLFFNFMLASGYLVKERCKLNYTKVSNYAIKNSLEEYEEYLSKYIEANWVYRWKQVEFTEDIARLREILVKNISVFKEVLTESFSLVNYMQTKKYLMECNNLVFLYRLNKAVREIKSNSYIKLDWIV